MKRSGAILPGAVIGILGGGQLGRMTAMAARSYGYRVQVLDPEPACPARFVVDTCICADFGDARAAAGLARGSDVVTVEIESIPSDALRAADSYAPLRPGISALSLVSDRALQKKWLSRSGFPCAPFQVVSDVAALADALQAFFPDCFVKRSQGGYDGRGQLRCGTAADAAQVFDKLGPGTLVVEQAIPLAAELSVLVARRPRGDIAVFPVAYNHHVGGILRWSVLPAPQEEIPFRLSEQAQELARSIAEQLAVEGLLTVELFVNREGALLVNELAVRPHNTFHTTERATCVSQFEAHVRAVCDLPLGDVSLVKPAAIVNLLGDLWLADRPLDVAQMLDVPTLRLHLYEKAKPKPGRKMGHLSALGETPTKARDRVLHAYQMLTQTIDPKL